jgi:hypothetical protein
MRQRFNAAMLLMGGLVALPVFSAEQVMTAPRAPSAGQATTLIFSAPSLGLDLDPATQPVASVEGAMIRIDLNAECDQVFCDALADTLFRVDLPPLEEGEYVVAVHGSAQSSQSMGSFEFVVGPAVAVTLRRPAEGAWSDQSRPGTGLHLQHRGPLLAVSQFGFREDQAHWRLDVAPLQGDSLLLLLRDYDAGSCFGCDPYVAPAVKLGGTPLLISFDSARRARAELVDGTIVPLVSLPFGADYVPFAMTDAADAEFGPLPLPDLSGTWAYNDSIQTFGPAEVLNDREVIFRHVEGSQMELRCISRPEDVATCSLNLAISPIPTPAPPRAVAALGDIEENRIRMVTNDEDAEVFYMVRLPSDE